MSQNAELRKIATDGAIRLYVSTQDPFAESVLQNLLIDGNVDVRRHVVDTLFSTLSAPDLLQLLSTWARASDTETRIRAINELDIYVARAPYELDIWLAIEDALKDPQERVRAAALQYLGNVTEVNMKQNVDELIHDPSELVRLQIPYAVLTWGRDGEIILTKLAQDPSPKVRLCVLQACQNLRTNKWVDMGPDLQIHIADMLKDDPSEEVRKFALNVLAQGVPHDGNQGPQTPDK